LRQAPVKCHDPTRQVFRRVLVLPSVSVMEVGLAVRPLEVEAQQTDALEPPLIGKVERSVARVVAVQDFGIFGKQFPAPVLDVGNATDVFVLCSRHDTFAGKRFYFCPEVAMKVVVDGHKHVAVGKPRGLVCAKPHGRRQAREVEPGERRTGAYDEGVKKDHGAMIFSLDDAGKVVVTNAYTTQAETNMQVSEAVKLAWEGADDMDDAIRVFSQIMETDRELYNEVVTPNIPGIIRSIIGEAKRTERRTIWGKRPPADAFVRPAAPDQRAAVLARINSMTILDMRLRSGKRLGDAEYQDVVSERDYYAAMSDHMGEKARFFARIAENMKADMTVSESLGADQIEAFRVAA